MCGVLHRNLGKGARCALPLHPSGPGSSKGIEPIQSHQNVSPFHHSQETSLSLHPSIKGAIAPPLKSTRRTWRSASPSAPNHARTAGRSITNQGSLRAPTDTPMRISSRPLHGDQPSADWMPPTCRRWIALLSVDIELFTNIRRCARAIGVLVFNKKRIEVIL